MGFPEEIKRIRQRCFLTQQDFAKEIQVAFSTVNRWEGGKAKPNRMVNQNIDLETIKHYLVVNIHSYKQRMLKLQGYI